MSYHKECYERRKNNTYKKASNDEFIAYKEIRQKWGFPDTKIKELLGEYTKKEILAGEVNNGVFSPKEMIFLDKLIIAIFAILCITVIFQNDIPHVIIKNLSFYNP